jgi:hypothetical protein
MVQAPSFSIAMATYNGEAYLLPQLESIAAQILPPLELQIGDDGSTDATPAIVMRFAREAPFPVIFHRNSERLGYAENFIRTARRCKGDWIAFCDQDDVWLPHKLAACASALEEAGDDGILAIVHAADVVDGELLPLGLTLPAKMINETRDPLTHSLSWSHYGFAQLFSAGLVREVETWPRVPTVFTDIDRYPHDVWISSLSNALGRTLHLATSLVLYRRHALSVTQTAKSRGPSRLKGMIATGAEHYAHVAAVFDEAAICMDHHGARQRDPGWAESLADAATLYRRAATVHRARAAVYRSGSLAERLRAILDLCSDGYRGLGASSLGWASLSKDLVVALGRSLMRQTAAPAAPDAP